MDFAFGLDLEIDEDALALDDKEAPVGKMTPPPEEQCAIAATQKSSPRCQTWNESPAKVHASSPVRRTPTPLWSSRSTMNISRVLAEQAEQEGDLDIDEDALALEQGNPVVSRLAPPRDDHQARSRSPMRMPSGSECVTPIPECTERSASSSGSVYAQPQACNAMSAAALGSTSVVIATRPTSVEPVNEEDEEAMLLAKCMHEGPPGPAGDALALTGIGGKIDVTHVSRSTALGECVGWLCALRAIGLPFDSFHLGRSSVAAVPLGVVPTFLQLNNLAAVAQQPSSPRRWHLAVLIRKVELVAGEIDVVVGDPTGELQATVDRRVLEAWPRAGSEGTALLLADVVAVPPANRGSSGSRSPRLLIMPRSVAKAFSACDVEPEVACNLLREARQ